MKHYRELIVSRPDMELVDVYGDKGRTGRSIADRPDFRRMLADCEAGRIDLILTKSISRFARNMGECVGVLRRLKELGIPVMFEKENLNSMEAQGELMLSIFGGHRAGGEPLHRPERPVDQRAAQRCGAAALQSQLRLRSRAGRLALARGRSRGAPGAVGFSDGLGRAQL